MLDKFHVSFDFYQTNESPSLFVKQDFQLVNGTNEVTRRLTIYLSTDVRNVLSVLLSNSYHRSKATSQSSL